MKVHISPNIVAYLSSRWLFFTEGALTLVISAAAFFIIPDFPSSPASWLTHEEHLLARLRMEEDLRGLEGDRPRQANESGLQYSLTDCKIWWLGISLSSMIVALSFGNFFPTLCATMGHSPTITLLLCAPPWLTGTITSFLVSRFFVFFSRFALYLTSLSQTLRFQW